METAFSIFTLVGWGLLIGLIVKFEQYKKRLHCPRCGKPWKKSNNEADDTFMCKCGMTTYDRHKFEGTFEERSENY